VISQNTLALVAQAGREREAADVQLALKEKTGVKVPLRGFCAEALSEA
jgi:hypothetical protein